MLIRPTTAQIRAALVALGVPRDMLSVEEVHTTAELYDPAARGVPAGEGDQLIGLTALLHRMATVMRANVTVAAQSGQDTGEQEEHVLSVDTSSAYAADLHLLIAAGRDPEDARFLREQLAGNLARLSEETRWLSNTAAGLVVYTHEELARGQKDNTGAESSDALPAPLLAASIALNATHHMLMIAYLEVAAPDEIDSDEAATLGLVLRELQQVQAQLLRYGLGRGMLREGQTAAGRRTYTVVEDIVAAAAASAGDPEG